MQHRYVPDLGDFSKFVVIDALSGGGSLRTALVWYLVDPNEVGEAHKNDGKHTAYLKEDCHGYGACAPDLYKRFQSIHRAGVKYVGVYDDYGVIPSITYFAEPLSYGSVSLRQRDAWRMAWLDRALCSASEADLVVLDPDNSLLPERLSARSKSAIKYATLNECAAFYGGGKQTLVIYQHVHRQGSADQQADRALQRLSTHLSVPRSHTFALRFHRGTTRFYLVVPANQHREQIRAAADNILAGEWGRRGHFSMIV